MGSQPQNIDADLIQSPTTLRFRDIEQEREFRRFFARQGKRDVLRAINLSAVVFAISAPFDYFAIGKSQITGDVVFCWAMRTIVMAVLLLLPWVHTRTPKAFRAHLIVGSWVIAVTVFLIVTLHVHDEY